MTDGVFTPGVVPNKPGPGGLETTRRRYAFLPESHAVYGRGVYVVYLVSVWSLGLKRR
jgi:hypothetical protein